MMYRISPAWIGEMIQEVEVIKETKENILARLKQLPGPNGEEVKFTLMAKITKHYEIYPTWKEARERLIELATKRLFAAEKDLRIAKYHLRQAQLIKQKILF
jgi:hypothetical protein